MIFLCAAKRARGRGSQRIGVFSKQTKQRKSMFKYKLLLKVKRGQRCCICRCRALSKSKCWQTDLLLVFAWVAVLEVPGTRRLLPVSAGLLSAATVPSAAVAWSTRPEAQAPLRALAGMHPHRDKCLSFPQYLGVEQQGHPTQRQNGWTCHSNF